MEDTTVETTWRVGPHHRSATFVERLLVARHVAAYDYAMSMAKEGEIVVDVACGLGIGVEKVLASARSMLAMDLARSALESIGSQPRLSKIQANATTIPIRSNTVDAVLAFQLIEHVPRRAAVDMLREFERILKPGCLAFVTTPNARWRLLPFQKPWNPYHVREYRPGGLRRLCRDAGLASYEVLGLHGKGGAHEVELARVRQDPLAVYLRLPSWCRWQVRRLFGSGRTGAGRAADFEGKEESTLFEYTDDYRGGIDFMIVIRKEEAR